MKKIFITLACALALASCWNEPEITPSTEPEALQYALPQGDHDYDTRIVEFFGRTGTTLVYKFNESDLFFTGSTPRVHNGEIGPRHGYESDTDPLKRDSVYQSGWQFAAADQAYVGGQLDMMERLCFDFYPDSLLHKILPPTVYLVDAYTRIEGSLYNGLNGAPLITRYRYLQGPGYAVISYAGADIDAMTTEDHRNFTKSLNFNMIKAATDAGVFSRAEEFGTITTYTAAGMGANNNAPNYNRNNAGILGMSYYPGNASNRPTLDAPVAITATASPSPAVVDWDSYVAWIVSTTEAERTETPPSGNLPATFYGFLHPSLDKSGKIRRKYDIVVKHMLDNYGIDLVAIGNATLD